MKAPGAEDFRAGLTALIHIPGEHSALPTLLSLEVDGEKREVLASFLRELLTHPSSSPAARERIANKLEELDAQAAASR